MQLQEKAKDQKFPLPECQVYYIKSINLKIPQILLKMQSTHIMLLFFYIDGLHILQKQHLLQDNNVKQKLIEYIISLSLRNGSFAPSALYSQFPKQSKYQQGHIVFTYSAINCLKILGALGKVDKWPILQCLGRHQKPDGSFSSFQGSTQCDLRFIYSALSICRIFQDFSQINTQKAKQYIDSCYNFDGGYGIRPKNQSHCGAVFCAIASYQHLQVQIPLAKKLKTINFLVHRQTKHEEDSSLIGIQGRVGKFLDSCYSFWAGAALKIMSGKNLLNPEIAAFLMKCYKQDQKSFSKYIDSKSGDPIHTFHTITGLKILNGEADNIQLSQILKKEKTNNKQ